MGVEELETVLGYSLGKGRQQGEEKENIWGGGSSWMEACLLQWKKKNWPKSADKRNET